MATTRKKNKKQPEPAAAAPESPEMIRVPLPAQASYKPQRPLEKNKLIESQLEHFRHIYEHLPEEHKNLEHAHIKTEEQASEFIREVTARLHRHHGVHGREKGRKAP